MLLSFTFEGHCVQLLKGTPLKVLYDLDPRIPFHSTCPSLVRTTNRLSENIHSAPTSPSMSGV